MVRLRSPNSASENVSVAHCSALTENIIPTFNCLFIVEIGSMQKGSKNPAMKIAGFVYERQTYDGGRNLAWIETERSYRNRSSSLPVTSRARGTVRV
ncbi:conserved hypothetical protein [Vibrio crassostreae]|nr:conserved hypothetical protein [Vibrio crassostreae]CAK2160513.1 conserved hypothetical protein [Vibrio crassostreae]CAK2500613.1 conserved hypothetical protein [Vibrio crassostreae]CAK3522433.1 conserved hypothetical protein [Vibrio crassostreae]CAK4001071.1 conserved hypothetical protein [Vibrio crassostreae]